MRRNLSIIIRVGKKGVKKILKGDLNYKGRNPVFLAHKATNHLRKKGLVSTLRRVKHELVSIDRRIGNNLAFPNGLVSGVEASEINNWYIDQKRNITIVIPSYNDLSVLAPCVKSIQETTDSDYVKIIIVDDYCHKENANRLAELENDQVNVVYREENGGFAKAINTGINAASKKDDIILLNSDIIAHPGWLEALQYGAYEFGVDTGIVGPKLLYPDGRIQSAGSHRNTEAPEFFDHYYRFQDSSYGPANVPQYCIGVTGACMYIKREVINNVGILDDKFQFAFEDMDFCLRAWNKGYRSLYFPASTLTHYESVTRQKNPTISKKEKQSISYFWEKWGKWFDERNITNDDGKKRIIFVLQLIGLSGGIKNIFEIANRLIHEGYAVEIWSLDKSPSPWDIDEKLVMRTFKNYERLTNALSSEEAIKVATWWETAFPVWLASVSKGVPVYYISEFETWFYPDDVIAQASVVACYRKEFRNITISPYNLDELQNIGLNATVIPCGYDDATYRRLDGVARKNNTLMAVGRTFFQKNFEMTYQSWKSLGDKRPELLLYGFEPEIAKRDSKITYIKKPSNEEVNEMYNSSTIFIQTSRHEGFCLPILEAMAAGCPVVCTDAHGNRGFCEDKKNCLMVDHDDIDGARTAIQKLIDDPSLRRRLSKNALKTAEDYRWEIIIKKLSAFFGQVK
ncbi:glycosyltransferase [Candidatus Saccharibacteria bacterium]|nr:glycosyltransferase [Candidatus Saccharibacteria bacterium]